MFAIYKFSLVEYGHENAFVAPIQYLTVTDLPVWPWHFLISTMYQITFPAEALIKFASLNTFKLPHSNSL